MTTLSTHSKQSQLSNLALLITVFYLSYLALITQPIIFNDAQGYHQLAQIFLHDDWKKFFILGPSREPLYPMLMAAITRLADFLNAPYFTWQLSIQMGLLVMTQIITRWILRALSVSDTFIAIAILWIGFSPALVNSGLILYSESLSYPLILWSLYITSQTWFKIPSLLKPFKSALYGVLIGSSWLLTTLVKSSFEPISLAVIFIFSMATLSAYLKKQKHFTSMLIIVLSMICVYQAPILTIKSLNKKYNGNFTLTSRASTALQGNTQRLVEAPLNKEHLLSAASYIPGLEFCDQLKLKECYYWSVPYLDLRIHQSNEQLANQTSIEEFSNKNMMNLAKLILTNPLPYTAYSTMEALKMFFWEGTQTSYLTYPSLIEHLYLNQKFLFTLRFVSAGLCLFGMIYCLKMLWKLKKKWWDLNQREQSACHLFWIMLLTMLYIVMMSRFYLIPRYALPIAPLFIIMFAYWLNSFNKKSITNAP